MDKLSDRHALILGELSSRLADAPERAVNPTYIAQEMALSETGLEEAIERLIETGLIETEGDLVYLSQQLS